MNYNIDTFYKRIVTKAHSSVKNNSWDEFEKLLDSKTRKREKFYVFFIMDILFFCTLFIWNSSVEDNIINNFSTLSRYNSSKSNSIINKSNIQESIKTKNQTRKISHTFQREDLKSNSKSFSLPIIETNTNVTYSDIFKELEKKITKASLLNFEMAPHAIPPVIRLKKQGNILSRWSISIGLSNGSVHADPIISNHNYNIHHNYITKKNEGEQLNKFVSLQLIGNYKVRRGVSFLAGINYTGISQTVKYDFKRTEIPIFDSTGKAAIIGYTAVPTNVASPVLLKGNNQYHLLEMPIGANLNFKINRRIIATYSMSTNVSFLLGNMGQTIDPQTLEVIKLNRDNSLISKINFSTNTSLGVDYLISNRTYWFIQAQYMKYFSSNSLDKNYKFNTIAFKVGLGFRLYK